MIYEENPLHVEMVQTLVPVAHEVQDEIRINVAGEPVIDPKRDSVQRNETRKTKCENAFDLVYLAFLILLLIGFFGAFILFLVWMSNPDVFGKNSNNY
jgi:nitrate reductase NapE component